MGENSFLVKVDWWYENGDEQKIVTEHYLLYTNNYCNAVAQIYELYGDEIVALEVIALGEVASISKEEYERIKGETI